MHPIADKGSKARTAQFLDLYSVAAADLPLAVMHFVKKRSYIKQDIDDLPATGWYEIVSSLNTCLDCREKWTG